MSTDDTESRQDDQQRERSSWTSFRSFFRALVEIPPPVKRLFDSVPLIIYPKPNELPVRAKAFKRHSDGQNVLCVFTTRKDAEDRNPSFNPGCLKWQVRNYDCSIDLPTLCMLTTNTNGQQIFLKFRNVSFITQPSNNHASPTGALPFLITTGPRTIVPSNQFSSHFKIDEVQSGTDCPERSVYLSTVDGPIRLAYLHNLYLNPEIFMNTTVPLYIESTSRNSLIRAAQTWPLQNAAREEIAKTRNAVLGPSMEIADKPEVVEDLYQEADHAWEALSAFLAQHLWFEEALTAVVDSEKARTTHIDPGMLDACVFAYSHTILSLLQGRLADSIKKRRNLVQHMERVHRIYIESA